MTLDELLQALVESATALAYAEEDAHLWRVKAGSDTSSLVAAECYIAAARVERATRVFVDAKRAYVEHKE